MKTFAWIFALVTAPVSLSSITLSLQPVQSTQGEDDCSNQHTTIPSAKHVLFQADIRQATTGSAGQTDCGPVDRDDVRSV